MSISIIVPIYNVEKYIRQCLDSLYKIKIDDKEVILVNDGSTDRCAEIVDEYYKKYSHCTVVVNKTNGGMSDARNAGLAIAKGDYISFIDSDDFIEPSKYFELYEAACKSDVEILVGEYAKFYDNDVKLTNVQHRNYNKQFDYNKIYKGLDYIEQIYDGKNVEVVIWRCLFKHSFLLDNKLCFVKNLIYEDKLFTLQYFYMAKKILVKPIVFYFYRKGHNSITKSISNKHHISQLYIAKELQKFIRKNNIDSICYNSLIMDLYFTVVRNAKLKNAELYHEIKCNKGLSTISLIKKILLPYYHLRAIETNIEI